MSIYFRAVYALLFFALLLEPHVIRGHLFPSVSPYADSLITIVVFIIGGLVYQLHLRDLRKKDWQNNLLKREVEEEREKLLDSFRHLGLVNRRASLIKRLTSDLLGGFIQTERHRKQLLQTLLQEAVVSIANTEWGCLRIIDAKTNRTLKEVTIQRNKKSLPSNFGNKELLEARDGKGAGDRYTLIVSANKAYPETCFLLLPKIRPLPEGGGEILQAVVDQAHLLYRYALPVSKRV